MDHTAVTTVKILCFQPGCDSLVVDAIKTLRLVTNGGCGLKDAMAIVKKLRAGFQSSIQIFRECLSPGNIELLNKYYVISIEGEMPSSEPA